MAKDHGHLVTSTYVNITHQLTHYVSLPDPLTSIKVWLSKSLRVQKVRRNKWRAWSAQKKNKVIKFKQESTYTKTNDKRDAQKRKMADVEIKFKKDENV